jgi:hypothetical protein
VPALCRGSVRCSRNPMSSFFRRDMPMTYIPLVHSFVPMLAFGFVGHVLLSSVKLRRVVEPGVPVVARNEGRVVPVPGP